MQVLWDEDVERLLWTLPPSDATRIVDGVIALAETGKGFVRHMLDDAELRLYIEGYAVDGGVMFVLRVRSLSMQI